MKRTKRTLSLLVALAMVLLSATTAFAAAPGTGEAVQVFPSPEELELLNESNLISTETIHYFVDEDGNVADIVVGDGPMPYSNSFDGTYAEYIINLYFYKVQSTYYVSMTLSARKDGWGFDSHKMLIRPKNNTKWMTHDTPHETHPKSVSDLMAFTYPDGAPSNVSVEVKLGFTLTGKDLTDRVDIIPYLIHTLDNPGNK